jgi:hypothetical protein
VGRTDRAGGRTRKGARGLVRLIQDQCTPAESRKRR